MILVDTSVWVGHFKGRPSALPLERLLEDLEVAMHPFIVGELVLGGLDLDTRRLLLSLPATGVATDAEVLALVDGNGLAGSGIGWVDAHLLAAARLCAARLWTADGSLAGVAATLDIGWPPP